VNRRTECRQCSGDNEADEDTTASRATAHDPDAVAKGELDETDRNATVQK
jgi:hypothetical protein